MGHQGPLPHILPDHLYRPGYPFTKHRTPHAESSTDDRLIISPQPYRSEPGEFWTKCQRTLYISCLLYTSRCV